MVDVPAVTMSNARTCVFRCMQALTAVFVSALVTSGALAQGRPIPLPLPPVTLDYFGLVLNRSDASKPWPSVPFGSWRIWDAYVTWPYLEPERGRWTFSVLDRMVAEAAEHRTKVLLVLAHSPAWASARPTEASGYKPGFSAEPKDMADWRNYVRTVAERYKGKVEAYQIWNEPSDKVHFSGTVQQIVDLTCEAYRIVRSVDPAAKIVSAGSAGGGRHIQYLNDFLGAGGAGCVDVVAHHFYVPRFGPEEMVPLIRQVRDVMRRQGVAHLPLWSTEAGWWIANTEGLPDHDIVAKGGWRKLDANQELGAVIQRAFLLARAEGTDRFYWYTWTNAYGWGLVDSRGIQKPGVHMWGEIVERMLNRQVGTCVLDSPRFSCELGRKPTENLTLQWTDPDALIRREGEGKRRIDPTFAPSYK